MAQRALPRIASVAAHLQPQAVAGAASSNAENYRGVFEGKLGFGKKCAVVVVDFCLAYTTPGSKWYCPGSGFGVVDAVDRSVELLRLARAKAVPVYYTQVYFEHESDGGLFKQKIGSIREWTPYNPLIQIDPKLTPGKDDCVFVKQYPSAFWGTNLASNLHASGVDTCIVIGCSTSGCVRATVLDGMCHGFRCIVPRECVGDRTEAVHEANLFDINAKMGDVVPLQDVLAHLNALA